MASDDLLIARIAAYVAEAAYMTAKRKHRASKRLHGQWVKAKARLAAMSAAQ